jgi:hypothetical protein
MMIASRYTIVFYWSIVKRLQNRKAREMQERDTQWLIITKAVKRAVLCDRL